MEHSNTKPAILAAIDIGTNNCRLLICRHPIGTPIKPSGLDVIDAFSRIVRLGEGLASTEMLSEAAMQRTLEALAICKAEMERRGITSYRAVATEACRRGKNADDFIEKIQKLLKIDVEIINPNEEARLALAGCTSLFDTTIPYGMLFDIGGGSTEIVFMDTTQSPPQVLASTSITCGVAALTEKYGGDKLSPETYTKMVEEISTAMQPFADEVSDKFSSDSAAVQMVGCSGTISTLAALSLGLDIYDRRRVDGSAVRTELIHAVIQKLVNMNYNERAAIACIGPDRADLVAAGCAVVNAIFNAFPLPYIKIADRGVREGILHDLIHKMNGGTHD